MRGLSSVPRSVGILLVVALSIGCSGSDKGGEANLKTAGKKIATILVVSTEGCVNTPRTRKLVEETATELGVAIEVKTVVVSTQAEAARYRFHGSPTVLVNGLDLDPAMRANQSYGFT